jgi:hypothetical protein
MRGINGWAMSTFFKISITCFCISASVWVGGVSGFAIVPPAAMLLIIIFCEEADADLSLGGVLKGIGWSDTMDALQLQDVL